ncbi:RNHCP domain-containing protein [Schleiferilactobacillus perolens]|uniref:RNHCP domain-containing protein n=1 Tax=Schleiferilactobacillus perolens TaxID=100468 RepID=UPI002357CC42|nr:RNHCP domain-containing protein [Schleiferilactobacillus perolens]MCI2169943.1 RNHCP domain-containing protein [Schleiferilactobacillus perolens]
MNRENKRKQYAKGYYKTHANHDSFTCKVCGRPVMPNGAGTDQRNHCPNCLSSLHVDIEPGDRQANCGGIMDPVAVWVRKGGEWAIIHRCRQCGELSSNRIAADDNPMKLMSIAMKPVADPPFPLDKIEEMTALMAGDGQLKF